MSLVLPVEQRPPHCVRVCMCMCMHVLPFLLDPHAPIRRIHSGFIVQRLVHVGSTPHLGAPESLGAGRRSAGRKESGVSVQDVSWPRDTVTDDVV